MLSALVALLPLLAVSVEANPVHKRWITAAADAGATTSNTYPPSGSE